MIDAFDGRDLPSAFATPAFFANVSRALAPGGAMAMNVIGTLVGHGDVQAVDRAARTAFGAVHLVPVLDAGETFSPHALRNVVVLARAS